MINSNLYKDIATRTNGDIYIGVVGPVRTGKSTFISKVMESFVLPNIKEKYVKDRAIDEMPQSGDGKLIMTTQPKFVPNEAVNIRLDNDVNFNIRLIDCVGYLIDGVVGHEDDNKPRMVATPWSDEDMPFEKAAEIGTKKVITDHSTISFMITTDGSFTGINRENYVEAEERVVNELKNSGKPFVIVLNTSNPKSTEVAQLTKVLKDKYQISVLACNISKITDSEINEMFNSVLQEFPISKVCVKIPEWMQVLPYEDEIIQDMITKIRSSIEDIDKINDIEDKLDNIFEIDEYFDKNIDKNIDLGQGKVILSLSSKQGLYYKVLSKQCGCDINNDFELISYIKELSYAKSQYDKLKSAIDDVDVNGYGVVYPNITDMSLEEPQIVKQGGKFGVKLKASAPSLHIMKVDIETEVNSLVGNEQQSEELVQYLMGEFENNPQDIWDTKMFGKSLYSLVNEGLQNKLQVMPTEVQKKMRKTLSRIVNEGKGGVICILL
ncbi:MAG: stage IV sporulation protein A [Clostridia bacterium]|nr:stage IV sporulation protein A [Clostridia bacterium]